MQLVLLVVGRLGQREAVVGALGVAGTPEHMGGREEHLDPLAREEGLGRGGEDALGERQRARCVAGSRIGARDLRDLAPLGVFAIGKRERRVESPAAHQPVDHGPAVLRRARAREEAFERRAPALGALLGTNSIAGIGEHARECAVRAGARAVVLERLGDADGVARQLERGRRVAPVEQGRGDEGQRGGASAGGHPQVGHGAGTVEEACLGQQRGGGNDGGVKQRAVAGLHLTEAAQRTGLVADVRIRLGERPEAVVVLVIEARLDALERR